MRFPPREVTAGEDTTISRASASQFQEERQKERKRRKKKWGGKKGKEKKGSEQSTSSVAQTVSRPRVDRMSCSNVRFADWKVLGRGEGKGRKKKKNYWPMSL